MHYIKCLYGFNETIFSFVCFTFLGSDAREAERTSNVSLEKDSCLILVLSMFLVLPDSDTDVMIWKGWRGSFLDEQNALDIMLDCRRLVLELMLLA